MKESIASRVGRIISGSMNAIIDAVENAAPETVMEEAIREVDGAIDEVRAELGKVVASKHVANQRLMDENHKHEELAEKIELAIAEKRDDLAEAAVAKQLDIEAQIPVLENTIADTGNQEKELESYITALQAKRREMKEELKLLRQSRQDSSIVPSDNPMAANDGIDASVRKAESAFDRVMERATGIVGNESSITPADASKLAELDELARNNRIQERLKAIKSRSDK